MGGLGSGRHGGRRVVSACCSLDINQLRRDGCLEPGWRGGLQWARNGETMASIAVRSQADRLHLAYRVRITRGDWEDVEQTIRIIPVPCRFGGWRPYFICPGVNGIACDRRVAKFYGLRRFFLCRDCCGLAYQSQREQPCDRVIRRVRKVRMRLGGDANVLSRFPERPKGMHWNTYERLRLSVVDAEISIRAQLAKDLDRLKRRTPKG